MVVARRVSVTRDRFDGVSFRKRLTGCCLPGEKRAATGSLRVGPAADTLTCPSSRPRRPPKQPRRRTKEQPHALFTHNPGLDHSRPAEGQPGSVLINAIRWCSRRMERERDSTRTREGSVTLGVSSRAPETQSPTRGARGEASSSYASRGGEPRRREIEQDERVLAQSGPRRVL